MQGMNQHQAIIRDVGDMLRDWRERRRLSQATLAKSAGVSGRLLAALEGGKELPNQDVVLRLAEHLDLTLRDRNALLIASGFPAAFPMRAPNDPLFAGIRTMVDGIVHAHMTSPALAIDRYWQLIAANDVLRHLIAGVAPVLLTPPVNWARVLLHPAGLAPRIANLEDWRKHVCSRLNQRFDQSADPIVAALRDEIVSYPTAPGGSGESAPDTVALPLRLMTVDGPLSFYTTSSVFPGAVDATLAELTIEVLHPADAGTADLIRNLAPPAEAG